MATGTAIARVFSGSVASWVRIGINLTIQLLGTPVFLSHWSLETYGLWLAFLSATGFLQIIDNGHQSLLENEFLRLGHARKGELVRCLSAGLPVAIVLGSIEFLAVLALLHFHGLAFLSAARAENLHALSVLMIAQSLTWLLFGSVGGLLVRSLSPFGYYSRFSWWGTLMQAAMAVLPLLAVVAGGGLMAAGLLMLSGVVAVNLLMLGDVICLYRREEIALLRPDLRLGLFNLGRSLVLSARAGLEMLRQQGARLILAPLSGAAAMAAFSTMRTGANVVLQGVSTLTSPLMPELMRFLNQRDQPRTEAAFGTVWLAVVALMTPAVLVLQMVAPQLFEIWARGKITFDPFLFALLSMGVLVYAVGQPAAAVAQGNNLLRPLFFVALASGTVAVGGMFLFVPWLGIAGAGLALLLAELVTLFCFVSTTQRWLRENELRWPWHSFWAVAANTAIAGIGVFAIAFLPSWAVLVGILALGLELVTGVFFWRSLPHLAKQSAYRFAASRIPWLKKLPSSPFS
jgi:O-antigen/teichoic acid export membrane protein